jgi:hypothetical protein
MANLDAKTRWVNFVYAAQRRAAAYHKGTQLHGTPLYAALLQDGPDAERELILAGAHLSPEESQNPAAAAALTKVLSRDFELKRAYEKAR